MRDRLIELIKQADEKAFEYIRENDHMDFIPTKDEIAGVYADHLLANGVIVLPVEIGKKLYDATEFFEECDCPEIYELKDDIMYIEKVGKDRFLFTYDGIYIHPENLGKTVFLTREEAEQALKERE